MVFTMVRFALGLVPTCLVYSLIVIIINFGALFLITWELNQTTATLPFLLLAEGGLGLTVGGVIVFFSPIGGKIEEIIFHSISWNAKRQKEAEKQARVWVVTGGILVFAALLLSAI